MDLFDTTQIALQRAIAGTSLRQQALASNLANADTPGYQRQDVDFQSALKSALSEQSVSPTQAENGTDQEALVDVSKARLTILRTALGVSG
jgi:flagellar basal-body rod protein FlgB